jgi:hypothetical protein
MRRFLALLAALPLCAGLLFALPPAAAQQALPPLQNGTQFGPSVTGSDTTAGMYFGTNRAGISGHIESGVKASGSVPAVSGCGTGTLATGSTDAAGTFTATGATGCTLTFGTAYAAAPSCVVTELTVNTAARTTTVSTTALVVASGTSGSTYSYICIAKSGG